MVDITALFSLSYGIYLISSHDPQQPDCRAGCLVNTVFQLTAEPVTVAVSVAKQNATHALLSKSGTMGVTVLDETADNRLLGPFGYRSSREMDKFAGICWHSDILGNPLVDESAVAHISCRVLKTVDMNTHTLFLCSVEAASRCGDGKPMTYGYFREVKKMKASRYAPTYVAPGNVLRREE